LTRQVKFGARKWTPAGRGPRGAGGALHFADGTGQRPANGQLTISDEDGAHRGGAPSSSDIV